MDLQGCKGTMGGEACRRSGSLSEGKDLQTELKLENGSLVSPTDPEEHGSLDLGLREEQ